MTGLMLVHQQSLQLNAVVNDLLIIWLASEAEEWHNVIQFLPL
jgi:hypothetical protein